jgi:hypothetical protein
LFVGKYNTNRSESCDLAFDQSTGLLYILHNIEGNRLEATNLSSTIIGNDRKFNVVNEYFLPFPTGNINFEGFALSEKCPTTNQVSAWLCRDVSSSEGTVLSSDVLRWFSPFSSDGNCEALSTTDIKKYALNIYPNPASEYIDIDENLSQSNIELFSSMGQKINFPKSENRIDISFLAEGIYFIVIKDGNSQKKGSFIKK